MSKPTTLAYKLSILCGASPLVVGTLIIVLYALTSWDWLMLAGILSIYGGLACFAFGAIALIVSYRKTQQVPRQEKRMIWGSTWFSALLLLSNFPVAACYLTVGFTLATRYIVVIQNHSTIPIEAVRIVGGGCDVPVGTIKPNGRHKSTFWIRQDGSLNLQIQFGSQPKSIEIDSYVTNSGGGNRLVVVNPDGSMNVDHPNT